MGAGRAGGMDVRRAGGLAQGRGRALSGRRGRTLSAPARGPGRCPAPGRQSVRPGRIRPAAGARRCPRRRVPDTVRPWAAERAAEPDPSGCGAAGRAHPAGGWAKPAPPEVWRGLPRRGDSGRSAHGVRSRHHSARCPRSPPMTAAVRRRPRADAVRAVRAWRRARREHPSVDGVARGHVPSGPMREASPAVQAERAPSKGSQTRPRAPGNAAGPLARPVPRRRLEGAWTAAPVR